MSLNQLQNSKAPFKNNDDLRFSSELSLRDINFLQRLPSVKHRNINIQETSDKNEVVILRDRQDKILLMTYYHNFGDFVFAHTTIGKDEYKEIFWPHYIEITTALAPTYTVLFGSAESIANTEKFGGREIYMDEVEQVIPDFIKRINEITGRSYYRKDNILLDKDDKIPVKNPLFYGTKDTFRESLG